MKRLVIISILICINLIAGHAQVFYQLNPVANKVLLREINQSFSSRRISFSESDFYNPPDLQNIGEKKYNTIISRTGNEIATIALNNLFGRIYYNEGIASISEHFFSKAEGLLTSTATTEERNTVYANLADLYSFNSNFLKADTYYRRIMSHPSPKFHTCLVLNAFTANLVRLNKSAEIIETVNRVATTDPPKTPQEEILYSLALARSRSVEARYSDARNLLLKCLEKGKDTGFFYYESLIEMARLELANNNIEQALSLLEEAKVVPRHSPDIEKMQLLGMLSDAAAKATNFKKAYLYLNSKKQIKDSVYKTLKFKNMLELEFQYENYKQINELSRKNEDVKIAAQNRRLLSQKDKIQKSKVLQTRLTIQKNELELQVKKKGIDYLNKHLTYQRAQLNRAQVIRNVTLAVGVLLMVILILLYRRYTLKSKTKKIIEDKNLQLGRLLSDRNWLLGEMHNQIKDNMNTIINLLKPKKDKLDNHVLNALKDSENRVFAMSLIHEKLFQSGAASQVNIKEYIAELTANLKAGLSGQKNITIELNINSLYLNETQVVPLGIIVNEAVTNAFKHGFPTRDDGKIVITIARELADFFHLTVIDDGVGLPQDFNIQQTKSLGFRLIKGLSHQLEGDLKIEGNKGTFIGVYNIRQKVTHSIIQTPQDKLVVA